MSIANTQPHITQSVIPGAAPALQVRRQSDTPSTSTSVSNATKVTLPPISSIIGTQQTSPRVQADYVDDERSNSALRANMNMKQPQSTASQTPRKLSSTQLSVPSQTPATGVPPSVTATPSSVQQGGSISASRAMSQVSQSWRPQILPASNSNDMNYYTQPTTQPVSVPPSVGTAPVVNQTPSATTPTQTPSGSPNANYTGASGQSRSDSEAAILQHHNIMLQQQQIQQHMIHQQQIQQQQQQGYYYVFTPMQQQQQPQQIPMAMSQGQPQMMYQPMQAMPQMQQQPQQPQQPQPQMAPYPVVMSIPGQADPQQRILQPQPMQQPQMLGPPMQTVDYENNAVMYQMAPRPDMMQPGQPMMMQPNGMAAPGMPTGVPPGGLVPPHQAIKATVDAGFVQTDQGLIPVPSSIQSNLSLAVRLRKQCPVCGKICSRPSTLKTHYLIHTGDTPFKCPWKTCKKSFNVKSNMLRHLKSHQKKAEMPEEDHTYVSDSENVDDPKVKEEAIAKEIGAAALAGADSAIPKVPSSTSSVSGETESLHKT